MDICSGNVFCWGRLPSWIKVWGGASSRERELTWSFSKEFNCKLCINCGCHALPSSKEEALNIEPDLSLIWSAALPSCSSMLVLGSCKLVPASWELWPNSSSCSWRDEFKYSPAWEPIRSPRSCKFTSFEGSMLSGNCPTKSGNCDDERPIDKYMGVVWVRLSVVRYRSSNEPHLGEIEGNFRYPEETSLEYRIHPVDGLSRDKTSNRHPIIPPENRL